MIADVTKLKLVVVLIHCWMHLEHHLPAVITKDSYSRTKLILKKLSVSEVYEVGYLLKVYNWEIGNVLLLVWTAVLRTIEPPMTCMYILCIQQLLFSAACCSAESLQVSPKV